MKPGVAIPAPVFGMFSPTFLLKDAAAADYSSWLSHPSEKLKSWMKGIEECFIEFEAVCQSQERHDVNSELAYRYDLFEKELIRRGEL